MGLAAGSSTTFSNFVLLFNGNEGGNAGEQPITLTNLALNLFSPTGTLLGSFTLASPYSVSAFFEGTGTAGFGFQLDATQAAQANAALLANPSLVIGTAARATGANAGPETISLSTLSGTTSVPDAGGTVALLGLGLLALAGLNRRFKR